MVQLVENWALLNCRLIEVRHVDGVTEVDVFLEKSEAVAGFPNFIPVTADGKITIRFNHLVPTADVPKRFRVKVRRSAPRIVWGDADTIVSVDQ